MKNKKINKKYILFICIAIIILLILFFICKKVFKNNKYGDNMNSQEIVDYILNINSYDIETQEILAGYYSENAPKSRAIEHYEQILMYDNGNVNAVESLAKLYDELQIYDKAIEMYKDILNSLQAVKEDSSTVGALLGGR